MTLGGPNRRTRAAFIYPPLILLALGLVSVLSINLATYGVFCEAGIPTVMGPSWSHTKNAINLAGSVWLAFADTR